MLARPLLLLSLCLLVACGNRSDLGYRIGRDELFYPADIDNKQWDVLAFSDDLLRAISQREKFRISLYPAAWQRYWYLIRRNQLDGVLSALPDVPSTRAFYDFSDVYLFTGPVLVARLDSSIASVDDLRGKTVAVPPDSSWMLTISAVPDVVLQYYDSAPDALFSLSEGNVDGVIMAAIPAYALLRNAYAGTLHVVTPPLTREGIRLLTKKGQNEELIERFNRGLRAVIEDGTYDRLQRKWMLNLREGPQLNVTK